MSIETMTKLGTVTVGAGGSANVDFTNIPQTYTDLQLVLSGRYSTSSYPNAFISLNGSTSSFSTIALYGDGATASSTNAVPRAASYNPGSSQTASTFGSTVIYISNYTSGNYKSYSIDTVSENNDITSYCGLFAGLWSNTAAITQVTLTPQAGNFTQHSTATLYGIKSMRTAVGNSIKATGGAISFDGTYVTHTFNTTDNFTPTTNLLVDYLVVAGGGGGGNRVAGNGGGGGGGAGGLRTSIGLTQMLVNPYSYTVTVGAGGAINASGSTSSFSSISSSGGGYGGNNGTPYAGASGGSGGGSIRSDSGITVSGGAGNAGGYSPVEGYAGGSGSGPGGGGGGAGAVGTNSGASGGDGGVGVTSSLSGTSKYYAGGGGGAGSGVTGNNYGAGVGGLGGGGNGGGSSGLPSAGTANTGGGGGGQQFYPNTTTGGAGGSGIVIVRYKA
jgi:hypothetical protein